MSKYAFLLFALGAVVHAQPTIQGISNAASNLPTFSPGSLVSVYGANFGTAPTISVGGKTAFLIAGSSNSSQLLVQLPVDLPTGPTSLTVTVAGQNTAPINLTVAAYAPAIFTAVESGITLGAFQDAVTGANITAVNPAKPGENLSAIAVGLGATNPVVATGVVSTGAASTTATATLTVGGENATVLYAGVLPNNLPGLYQVNFTVPKDATGCGTAVILSIGGISAPTVSVPIGSSSSLPAICSLENSATGLVRDSAHGAAPNSFVSIYASGTVAQSSAGNIFPATDYQGVEASFGGAALPIYSVTNIPPSEILINTIIPSTANPGGSGTVVVKTPAGSSQSYTVGVSTADVGVFRLPDPSNPAGIQGVALLANSYWFAMPNALAAEYGLKACTGLSLASPCGQPANPGDAIVIYFTGGGLATPNGAANGTPVPTGSVAPADGSVIYKTVVTPTITIGGLPATVGFSGIAPGTGSEYQINTVIPAGVVGGDAVPVILTFGTSSDTFTIAVK